MPIRSNRLRRVVAVLATATCLSCAARREPETPLPSAETFDTAWAIVRDEHFDEDLNGVDWNAVRDELRPRALAAADAEDLRAVLDDMLGRLGQSHFAVSPGGDAPRPAAAPGGAEPGFEFNILATGEVVVVEVDPGGPAGQAGIRAGWILRSVDGERQPPGSGPPQARYEGVAAALDGPPGSSAHLEFEDGVGRLVSVDVVRRVVPGEPVRFGNLPPFRTRFDARLLEDAARAVTVGVVRFNLWMPVLAARFDEAVDRFRSADGMVVDLRGNLGGVAGLVMGTAGHFLDRRVDLGTMKTRESEMRFYANPRLVTADGRRVTPFAGPLAILVDARTASTSEVFAGGLQDLGRARVFGSRTAGAVLPALMERLPSGDVLYHAVADYRTPSGVVLEGRGVIPDEIVPVTREDLLAGRDAALEAALDWMARETTQEDAR